MWKKLLAFFLVAVCCFVQLKALRVSNIYLGCDSSENRLALRFLNGPNTNGIQSIARCGDICFTLSSDYKFFGWKNGTICKCGMTFKRREALDSNSKIDEPCEGLRVFEIDVFDEISMRVRLERDAVRQSAVSFEESANTYLYAENGDQWVRNVNDTPVQTYEQVFVSEDVIVLKHRASTVLVSSPAFSKTPVVEFNPVSLLYEYRMLTNERALIAAKSQNGATLTTKTQIRWDITLVDHAKEAHYFYRVSNCAWIEKDGDSIVELYNYVKFDNEGIILASKNRRLFEKLFFEDGRSTRWGTDLNEMKFNSDFRGMWANLNGKEILSYFINEYKCETE